MAVDGVRVSESREAREAAQKVQVNKTAKVDGLFVLETVDGAGHKATVLAFAFAGAVFTFPAEVARNMTAAPEKVREAVLKALGS